MRTGESWTNLGVVDERRRAAILLVTALAATAALAAATAQSAEGGLIGTGAASGCDMAASHPFEAWGEPLRSL
jgi:hypothetical protein